MSYLASVTEVVNLGGDLWECHLRLNDGSNHIVVVPAGKFTVEQIRIATQAVLFLTTPSTPGPTL